MGRSFINTVLAITFSFASVSCADPHYLNSQNESGGRIQGFNSLNCDLIFSSQKLCIVWTWEKQPTENETGSIWFRTYQIDDRDGFPQLVDSPSVPFIKLWMPSMGHGSSPVQVENVGTGTYKASGVYFSMPGKWQIKFQIKSGSTVIDEVIVDYTL